MPQVLLEMLQKQEQDINEVFTQLLGRIVQYRWNKEDKSMFISYDTKLVCDRLRLPETFDFDKEERMKEVEKSLKEKAMLVNNGISTPSAKRQKLNGGRPKGRGRGRRPKTKVTKNDIISEMNSRMDALYNNATLYEKHCSNDGDVIYRIVISITVTDEEDELRKKILQRIKNDLNQNGLQNIFSHVLGSNISVLEPVRSYSSLVN